VFIGTDPCLSNNQQLDAAAYIKASVTSIIRTLTENKNEEKIKGFKKIIII